MRSVQSCAKSAPARRPSPTKRQGFTGAVEASMSSLSVTPIHDAYGVIVGASKLAHDCSARKDAERLQSVSRRLTEPSGEEPFCDCPCNLAPNAWPRPDRCRGRALIRGAAIFHGTPYDLPTPGNTGAGRSPRSRFQGILRTDLRSPALQARCLQGQSLRSVWRFMPPHEWSQVRYACGRPEPRLDRLDSQTGTGSLARSGMRSQKTGAPWPHQPRGFGSWLID